MRLDPYKEYFSKGLWHVHTNYTDGKNTVHEYCADASKHNIPLIAFTEHVRKELTYDFDSYLNEIANAKNVFKDMVLLGGCETKVLDMEGNLDAPSEVLKKSEVIIGVFHTFPFQDKEHYLEALKNMLRKAEIDILGHPTMFTQKNGIELDREEIEEIVSLCMEKNIIIESNKRYDLPGNEFITTARDMGAAVILGNDKHKVE